MCECYLCSVRAMWCMLSVRSLGAQNLCVRTLYVIAKDENVIEEHSWFLYSRPDSLTIEEV